jgi:hypothetical protein
MRQGIWPSSFLKRVTGLKKVVFISSQGSVPEFSVLAPRTCNSSKTYVWFLFAENLILLSLAIPINQDPFHPLFLYPDISFFAESGSRYQHTDSGIRIRCTETPIKTKRKRFVALHFRNENKVMLWHCTGGAVGCWCRHRHGGGLNCRHHSCRGHCRQRQGAFSIFSFYLFLLIIFGVFLQMG